MSAGQGPDPQTQKEHSEHADRTLTFVNDTGNPTGPITITWPPSNSYLLSSQSVQISLTASDTGSGVETTQLHRQAAPLNGTGGCGSYE